MYIVLKFIIFCNRLLFCSVCFSRILCVLSFPLSLLSHSLLLPGTPGCLLDSMHMLLHSIRARGLITSSTNRKTLILGEEQKEREKKNGQRCCSNGTVGALDRGDKSSEEVGD